MWRLRVLYTLLGHLAFFWALVFACPAVAQSVHIRDLAVLAYPQGTETLASVRATERQADFKPVIGGFAGGYTRQVHWFRFSVEVPPHADETWLEIQPPYLDDLRLYAPDAAGGALRERVAGDRLPFSHRELATTAPGKC
jgi:hypothetical protein